ncbi:MAG: hypothetical protein QY331_13740 [Melioribacteraceae bacterium]|nr:hypothetical protein [Melioribacteraceae bacterium]RJP57798.1 MAG: hypothetical protein C4543_09050 [Ignavibacteriales bacterium]WKZ69017.1 MAG: hypothetical protein QY331_13740 [Melioribacteraceae bacterium]
MSNSFFNVWLPFIYLYGVGGIFFTIGMVLVKKAGGYNPAKRRHRYWWKVTIFGFFYFVVLHFVWILLALNT